MGEQNRLKAYRLECLKVEECGATVGRRNSVEDGLELSQGMVACELTLVKDNLLAIRMDVGYLTQ